MMLDRYVEAIEDCDKAISIMPRFLRLLDRKGRALLKIGKISEAEETFRELMKSCQEVEGEDNLKRDAVVGLELATEATLLIDKLSVWSSPDHRGFLLQCEQLLAICTQFRFAQVFKMIAMCRLCMWEDAKAYAESVISSTHSTIQRIFSSEAAFGSPPTQQLLWHLVPSGLNVDTAAVGRAILCMGPDLAKIYVRVLKNIDVVQSYPNKAMENLIAALATLGFLSNKKEWSWVLFHSTRLSEYADIKTVADEKFRSSQYFEAAALYGEALKKDHEAVRWNALLHCNRAAAYLNAEKFSEAIEDCNQALSLDKTLILSFLRRARAHKALGNIIMSIRDYRKYLSTKPRPDDADEVDLELDELLELECSDKGEAAVQLPPSPPRKETLRTAACDDQSNYVRQLSEVSYYCLLFDSHL
jgi:DnaJ family protein C protein 7